jgi:hypothetical protein
MHDVICNYKNKCKNEDCMHRRKHVYTDWCNGKNHDLAYTECIKGSKCIPTDFVYLMKKSIEEENNGLNPGK